MGANELLAKSLQAFCHLPNRRVTKVRACSDSTYDLLGLIDDHFRAHGIIPHTVGWEEKAVALDAQAA